MCTMFFTARLSFTFKSNYPARAPSKLLPMLHTGLHTGRDSNEVCKCGGGLGGTSAAYYLRQLWGDKPLEVDIFESRSVGGRLALVNVDGQDYEAGGAVIHPRNRYLGSFAEEFGLGRKELNRRTLGLFNNEEGLYFKTSPWKFISRAKVFARYGRDIKRVQKLVAETMVPFDRIYDHQNKGVAFTTLENLLDSMDEHFVEHTQTTTANMLRAAGFSDRFINELAKGSLMGNYSQTIHAPGFLGTVSMAGVESGLWKIPGGQKQFPEKLLEASGATLIHGEVTSVFRAASPRRTVSYEVQYKKAPRESGRKKYDVLIIAAPLDPGRKNQIQFEDFPGGLDLPKIPYHPLQVLFTHGKMNKNFCGKQNVPTHIMATDTDIFFNKIQKQTSVNNGKDRGKSDYGVWKIYLKNTPTEEQLGSIFDDRKDMCLLLWRAFPEYTLTMELPPFVLHDRLYYANAIEAAATSMEMAVIGGRNVANLAFNQWFDHTDRIDSVKNPSHLLHK
ncbi:prenylcysteine oxidase 1-like isoform X2 [Littorina saxatilis]|uniref:Prenylcysteine lyase domain-containing protein n=1 Tax=Littorina saxatilis TaxID=31220 RepID=A0AAN9B4C6_9CAEN